MPRPTLLQRTLPAAGATDDAHRLLHHQAGTFGAAPHRRLRHVHAAVHDPAHVALRRKLGLQGTRGLWEGRGHITQGTTMSLLHGTAG